MVENKIKTYISLEILNTFQRNLRYVFKTYGKIIQFKQKLKNFKTTLVFYRFIIFQHINKLQYQKLIENFVLIFLFISQRKGSLKSLFRFKTCLVICSQLIQKRRLYVQLRERSKFQKIKFLESCMGFYNPQTTKYFSMKLMLRF